MPLLICTVFFAVLFTLEGAWYLAGVAAREREIVRYQRIEHPRRLTSDRYLDILG